MTERTVQCVQIAHGNTVVKGGAYATLFVIEMPFFCILFSSILFPRISICDLTLRLYYQCVKNIL